MVSKSMLGDVTVSKKIMILLALVILGSVLLFTVTLFGEGVEEAATHKKDSYDELYNTSQKLAIMSLQMRRNEKDFLLRGKEKYIKKYEDSATHALIIAGELEESPILSDEQRIHVGEFKGHLEDHKAQFLTVTDLVKKIGMSEKEGLRGSMRKSVHDVESVLKKFDSDSLMVAMLMMRRHEKDFIIRKADKYIKKMADRHETFRKKMGSSSLDSGVKNNISNLMKMYHKDFKALSGSTLILSSEIKKLSAIFKEFTNKVDPFTREVTLAFEAASVEREEKVASTKFLLHSIEIAVSFAVVLLGLFIARTISEPLRKIATVTESLSQGEEVDVPYIDNKDEIGTVSRALQVFKEQSIENKRQDLAQVKQKEQAEHDKRESMKKLAVAFEERVQTVVQTVGAAVDELSQTAESMNHTIVGVEEMSANVAKSSEETNANVGTVASAAEEMSSSVGEISQQLIKTNSVVDESVQNVENAGANAVTLSEAADRIGNVVQLIKDIAEQINLLALNATIESARAGDAGKGFAVVASEVKNLAGQAAQAVDEINQEVESVQAASKDVAISLDLVKSGVLSISEYTNNISAAVEEQSASTQEISSSMQTASTSVSSINTDISNVTQASQAAREASTQVLTVSQQLSVQSDLLSSEISKFIAEIQADSEDV